MRKICGTHLSAKVRDYARNAEKGEVLVRVIENLYTGPAKRVKLKMVTGIAPTDQVVLDVITCYYCNAPAEFMVSYNPKK